MRNANNINSNLDFIIVVLLAWLCSYVFTRIFNRSPIKGITLLHENKVNGSDEADEGCKVVPVETFVLEHQMCHDGEYQQGNTLLNHLQLYE